MSYLTDKNIQDRVQEHYNELKKIIPEQQIVGVFLQGSQNYGLGYEGSDVDTKAIVLPCFKDFVLNKKPVSTTHVLDNEEHIDIKDIRVMFENIKKQNINFVEILFTEYKVLNPIYKELFSPILDIREEVGRYNIYAALNCMCGMVMEKNKALCHPYPTTAWKIEKWGYDGKQLQHMFRVKDFMDDYICGDIYEDCLIAHSPQEQILIKTNQKYNLEEAKFQAQVLLDYTKSLKDEYMALHENKINKHVDEVMNQVLFDLLANSFMKDIEKYKTS